jgi:hypothetical protein
MDIVSRFLALVAAAVFARGCYVVDGFNVANWEIITKTEMSVDQMMLLDSMTAQTHPTVLFGLAVFSVAWAIRPLVKTSA